MDVLLKAFRNFQIWFFSSSKGSLLNQTLNQMRRELNSGQRRFSRLREDEGWEKGGCESEEGARKDGTEKREEDGK